MRLVTLAFATADEFLAAFHPADGGTISTRTRTDGSIGERVLIEVAVPGLPNRALLRADVTGIAFEHGLRFTIAPEDGETLAFVVGITRGDLRVEAAVHRDHARFPAALAATWRTDGDPHTTTIEDVSAGGAFVRTETPPALGTVVTVTLLPPGGEPLTVAGRVAWIRQGTAPGFGVDLDPTTGEPGRRLRSLLRHASETASVDLGVSAG